MKKILFIILFISAVKQSDAQRPKTGAWLGLQLPVNFNSNWQWHNDAGYRTLAFSADAMQFFYRSGIRYNISKQWNAAAGVAFFFTRTTFLKSTNDFGFEFRTWEEINHQMPVNEKLQLQLRLRTEQRFFAATNVYEEYRAQRFRFRSGLMQKLNDRWSLQLADEILQQQSNHRFSFNQNRLMFSGIYHLQEGMQLQGGYMWLRWPKESQQIITISLTKNIRSHG